MISYTVRTYVRIYRNDWTDRLDRANQSAVSKFEKAPLKISQNSASERKRFRLFSFFHFGIGDDKGKYVHHSRTLRNRQHQQVVLVIPTS